MNEKTTGNSIYPDIRQGYKTRDKEFVIEILSKALGQEAKS